MDNLGLPFAHDSDFNGAHTRADETLNAFRELPDLGVGDFENHILRHKRRLDKCKYS